MSFVFFCVFGRVVNTCKAVSLDFGMPKKIMKSKISKGWGFTLSKKEGPGGDPSYRGMMPTLFSFGFLSS